MPEAGDCRNGLTEATGSRVDSSPGFDLHSDVAALTAQLIDIPSESHDEALLADLVEAALTSLRHLRVDRLGNTVIARL